MSAAPRVLRPWRGGAVGLLLIGLLCTAPVPAADGPLFQTPYLAYPFPWSFQSRQAGITLVGDSQLQQLAANPDQPINLSVSATPRLRSLQQVCQKAQADGARTLSVAFDYFWAQYRKEFAGRQRALWPDTPEYVELIGKVASVAQSHGLGMKLSVLSPLEIGHGYCNETGEHGRWLHFREGLRDAASGAFSVQLWRQLAWTNNKGTIQLRDAGVRVFAFRERHLPGSRYGVVRPEEIREITESAQVQVFDGLRRGARPRQRSDGTPTPLAGYGAVRIRVYGQGHADLGPLDRVLVVQQYDTPEMDYFSASAEPYLRGLIDRYCDAGIHFNALYADEMHIQGDWGYARHHDHGEFALRYVSRGLEQRFAQRFGNEYRDLAKWMVYFCQGQHDSANDLTAKSDAMHVIGKRQEDVAATALFRARYYRMLQDGVVDLFADAKQYLEQRMGHPISSRAHATWAESPTIDHVGTGSTRATQWKYDYSPRFIASNTVHQAATACDDYFKWCDFLHGTGNDTAEGGWLDRNYWGFALASSLGVINRVHNAYAAAWGMPQAVRARHVALRDAWGTSPDWAYGLVQHLSPRRVDVLTLYPLDLVAWDARFGSWMTQYAYCDYLPQAQVLGQGRVDHGKLSVGRGQYTTVVVAFEPFPHPRLMSWLQQLAEQGGHVIWSGPPPLLLRDGRDARPAWQQLTGSRASTSPVDGVARPGHMVRFSGFLQQVAPMEIPTDLLPDRLYPLQAVDAETVAVCNELVVGTHRKLGKGTVTVLGFRPRDDQSASTGRDERTLFHVLHAVGAYPSSERLPDVQDNTEYLARVGPLFACRFPNGAVSIAPHVRSVEEQWPGGFHRDAAADRRLVAQLTLPDLQLHLDQFRVAGYRVTYTGLGAVTFRGDAEGRLHGFAGRGADRITLNENETVFADHPLPLVAWSETPPEQRIEGGARFVVRAAGAGQLRLPLPGLNHPEVVRQTGGPRQPADEVPATYRDGRLTLRIDGPAAWYYVLDGQPGRQPENSKTKASPDKRGE